MNLLCIGSVFGEISGLKNGDSIVSVNGQLTPYLRDFRNASRKIKSEVVPINEKYYFNIYSYTCSFYFY